MLVVDLSTYSLLKKKIEKFIIDLSRDSKVLKYIVVRMLKNIKLQTSEGYNFQNNNLHTFFFIPSYLTRWNHRYIRTNWPFVLTAYHTEMNKKILNILYKDNYKIKFMIRSLLEWDVVHSLIILSMVEIRISKKKK